MVGVLQRARDGAPRRPSFLLCRPFGQEATRTASMFRVRIEAVPGEPGQMNIIFSPRLAGRTYAVKAKPDLLTGAFDPLTGSTFTDNGQERTVTDLNATGAAKLYRVEITRP